MSDFSKRNYGGGNLASLQADTERSTYRLRKSMDEGVPYTPAGGATVWVSPAPTTLKAAVDRIAAALASGTYSTGNPIP